MVASNWKTPNPMPDEHEIAATYTADIVIIGGGQAGTCAARAATENGATVIVVEKKSERRMSYNGGGQVGQINSELRKAVGFLRLMSLTLLTTGSFAQTTAQHRG